MVRKSAIGFSLLVATITIARAPVARSDSLSQANGSYVYKHSGKEPLSPEQNLAQQTRGLLVRFKSGTTSYIRDRSLNRVGAKTRRSYHLVKGLELVSTPPGSDPLELADQLRKQPGVASVSLNLPMHTTQTPNDPFLSSSWGFAKIGAPAAWDRSTGSSDTVIAVLDSGVSLTHPDLQNNIWTNPGEIAGNGIDDDHNGYVDDVHGWNFVDNNNNPDDQMGHGTHVAGIIAAEGNNGIGVAGVNWHSKIMPLKICDNYGGCYFDKALLALQYAKDKGIKVSNNSYGGSYNCSSFSDSSAISDALQAMPEHLFVAAAGNSGANMDVLPFCPADINLPNVLTVAASTSADQRAYFSNFGMKPDLFGPGQYIFSTMSPINYWGLTNQYASLSGTSMAAPFLAGSAALLKSMHPDWNPEQIRQALISTATTADGLNQWVSSGGRLNLDAATALSSAPDALIKIKVRGSGSGTIRLDGQDLACGRFCLIHKPEGTQVALSVASAEGSTFIEWRKACTGKGWTSECSITMHGIQELEAVFEGPGANGWSSRAIAPPDNQPPLSSMADKIAYSWPANWFSNKLSQDGKTRLITRYNATRAQCSGSYKYNGGVVVQELVSRWNLLTWDTKKVITPPESLQGRSSQNCYNWGITSELSGSGRTILVSASPVGSSSKSCNAYVWQKNTSSQWVQQAVLTPNGASPDSNNTSQQCDDAMGFSGHLSADGKTVAYLHWEKNSDNSWPLKIDTWKKSADETWFHTFVVLPSTDTGCSSFIGKSLALSGNGNIMALGSMGCRAEKGSGRVRIYRYVSNQWQLDQTIQPPSSGDIGWYLLGKNLNLSNDGQILTTDLQWGQDGNSYPPTAGSSLLFTRQDGAYVYRQLLQPSDPVEFGVFGGCGVANTDYRVVCTATGARVGNNLGQGALYIFDGTANWSSISSQQKVITPDGVEGDHQGGDSNPAINADGTKVLSPISATNLINGLRPNNSEGLIGYEFTNNSVVAAAPTLTSYLSPVVSASTASVSFAQEDGAQYVCQLDFDQWVACTSPWSTSSLDPGEHTVQISRITDTGQIGSPVSYTWTVDTQAPLAPTITSKPANPSESQNASFSWDGAEADGSYQCALDSGAWESCTSPKTYDSLSDSSHTFQVRQTDQAGNQSAPASYTWTVDTLPPLAPNILSKPSSPSTSSSASFSWSGEAGGTYQCALDSGAWESCTSPKTYDSLSDSSHTFQVRQIDQVGNQGAPASYTWTVDTQAPLAPTITSKPANPSASSGAAFAWDGAETGGSYQCKLDSGAWEDCASPKSYTGLSDSSHTFQVRQTDQAGNQGSAASYSWKIDTQAPLAPFWLSKPSAYSTSSSASFSWSGREMGDYYQCALDSGAWEDCTSPKSYSGLSDSSHTLQVRQVDQAGNQGSAISYSWTVDTQAPLAPTLLTTPPDLSSSSAATFSWTGEEGGSYECKLDSGAWEGCTSPQVYSGLTDSPHAFQVRQIDQAGNQGSAASYTWTVALFPGPTLTSYPANPTSSTIATIKWTGSRAGGTYQCRRNSSPWVNCTSPRGYSSLREGTHIFQVRQIDTAGNVSDTTTYAWVVDTAAPGIPTITSTPSDPSPSVSASFSWTGAEDGGSYQCQLNSEGWSNCNSVQSYSGLTDSSYTFQVRQIDQAGNIGPAASYAWTVALFPAPTLLSYPDSLTSSTIAIIHWVGSRENGTYQCKLDINAWRACTVPAMYSSLPQGTHTFIVKQIDQYGYASDTAAYTWVVDTTPPAAPINFSAPGDPSSISGPFSWTGAEDGGSFQCQIDSGEWSSCTSPKYYSGLSDSSHTFQVRQIDQAGNQGDPMSYTWTVDTQAPLAPSWNSKPLSYSISTSATFTWDGAEAGGSYQCKLDYEAWESCPSPKSYSGLSDSSHTFQVRQIDQAGNQGTPISYTWTVDTQAPLAPTILSKPANPSASSAATFTWSGEEGATYQCKLDSGLWANCIRPQVYSGLSDSAHTFQVRQIDQAGNQGTPISYTWTVDTQAPLAPTILFKPANPSASSAATFTWSEEEGATYQCKLDSGSWAACTSLHGYSGLSDSTHTFQVRQIDQAGNQGSPASYDWTVDTQAPLAPTVLSYPVDPSASSAATFTWSGEEGATYQCKLDSGAWSVCTSPKFYSGLSDSSHTFQVRQIDQAGNQGSAASYSWAVDTSRPVATWSIPQSPINGKSHVLRYTLSFTQQVSLTPNALILNCAQSPSFNITPAVGIRASQFNISFNTDCKDGPLVVGLAPNSAYNALGLAASPTSSREVILDSTPPAATASGPARSKPAALSFKVTTNEKSTIVCQLGGKQWNAVGAVCKTPKLRAGKYNLRIVVTDQAGNQKTISKSVQITN